MVRSTADARAAQDQHVVEELDALDAIHLGLRQPGELADVPAGLGRLIVRPSSAGLEYADAIALLDRAQRRDAAAET